MIAMHIHDLKKKDGIRVRTYTHCEIHPSMILGVCASIIPFPDHNQVKIGLTHHNVILFSLQGILTKAQWVSKQWESTRATIQSGWTPWPMCSTTRKNHSSAPAQWISCTSKSYLLDAMPSLPSHATQGTTRKIPSSSTNLQLTGDSSALLSSGLTRTRKIKMSNLRSLTSERPPAGGTVAMTS